MTMLDTSRPVQCQCTSVGVCEGTLGVFLCVALAQPICHLIEKNPKQPNALMYKAVLYCSNIEKGTSFTDGSGSDLNSFSI